MNIIAGILSIIFEYYRCATWSRIYKGAQIVLSEDDSKATCLEEGGLNDGQSDYGHSVRAEFCIERGQIISWEFESKIIDVSCNFYGVISSQHTNFNQTPSETMEHAYGVDDSLDYIYNGRSGAVKVDQWSKPKFPLKEVFTVKFVADWRESQCKLAIYYNGKKLNDTNDEYTMLLPKLDDKYVWYPCVTPFNTDAYCIIRYA